VTTMNETKYGGCRGRDHMVVGFSTTCAISAYHPLKL
jgi:hypothetical protein